MLEGIKEAKRKNERTLEEHKAEEVRQKLKEDADKKKEQEAMLKNVAKSKKNLEENEMFEQEERKLDEELNLAQRMLDQATNLTEAIGKGDMVGVRVASELVNSSRKKVDEAVLMRKQHVKDRNELGKKRKNTIKNMFLTMKKSKK